MVVIIVDVLTVGVVTVNCSDTQGYVNNVYLNNPVIFIMLSRGCNHV